MIPFCFVTILLETKKNGIWIGRNKERRNQKKQRNQKQIENINKNPVIARVRTLWLQVRDWTRTSKRDTSSRLHNF